ncbi:MAG TPA: hypothetical protein VFZ15_04480, partial [Acidimicrobiia bacterium]|nr:hypothetical protein [Acidimicrobiia bacterium]
MADLIHEEKAVAPETPEQEPKTSPRPRRRRTLWLVLGMLAAFVIYAYGFKVTEVNLDRINDETRQESLFRVIRALGQPDLLTYDVAETSVDLEYAIPCPTGGFQPAPMEGSATFTIEPVCADPRSVVMVRGEGFRANDEVQ